MRFSFAIVALTATVVTAQLSSIVAKIPSCALTCLATGAAAAGCGVSDYACQCGEKRVSITTSATPCVLQGCTPEQALGTLSTVDELCKYIAANAAPASSSSSAAPATTAKPTTGTSTTAATAATTAPATTKATTSSAAGSSFGSSIASSIVSVAPTRATTTAPLQVGTNAASVMRAGVGMVGGAFLVALAL